MDPLETAAAIATIAAAFVGLVEFIWKARRWWKHRRRAKRRRGPGMATRPH